MNLILNEVEIEKVLKFFKEFLKDNFWEYEICRKIVENFIVGGW